MQWSYSRVNSFDNCPYGWYLTYIYKAPKNRQFFSDFGKLVHEILEKFYKGEIKKEDMLTEFLVRYPKDVQGIRPPEKVVQGYLKGGLEYLKSFEPLPFKCLGVEMELEFELRGHKFIGLVDFLGEKDGELYIVDHKSKKLYPRSRRKTPTKNDKEIDAMVKQLYLYAYGIKEKYGKFPKALCFNCFRTKSLIVEPFDINKYNEVIDEICKEIDRIIFIDDFYPRGDYFFCKYLCSVKDECEYAEEFTRSENS